MSSNQSSASTPTQGRCFLSAGMVRATFRTRVLLCAFIVGAILCGSEQAADAAQRKITRTVTRGQRLTVLADRCLLRALASSGPRVQRIRCEGRSRRAAFSADRNTIALRVHDQLSVFAGRNCELTRTRTNARRIDVRCRRPHATPTPTATATVTSTPTATATHNAEALTTGNQILSLNVEAPNGAGAAAAVTGLTVGDTLVAIDRRPQNGMLYGLGYNAGVGTMRLYAISSESHTAVPIGSTGTFVESDGSTPVRIGVDANTRIGMDFNPAVDRVRVVTSNGQNFRINPNTGAFVDGDQGSPSAVTGLNMDGALNGPPDSAWEAAYTNAHTNTSVTTLYAIDPDTNRVCIQNPPNQGTQTFCATMSSKVDRVLGFDIPSSVEAPSSNAPASAGAAIAFVQLDGEESESVASIDLNSGDLVSRGAVAGAPTGLASLALNQASGVDIVGVTSSGSLARFNSSTTSTVVTVAVTGLNGSESLVAIDWRPSTGQLFGLGFDSTNGTGSATLYRIDPQSGAATIVGTAGSIANGAGSPISLNGAAAFGFDFNPTVDRIRVVTQNGLNFRINPNDGTVVGGALDPAQNGATASATGAAYTNSFAGASVTTLYTLDAASDSLYIQNPPNNGTQTNPTPITVGGSSLDFTASNGFDIPREVKTVTANAAVESGIGFAALTVGGATRLYEINLVDGSAVDLGAIGSGATPLLGVTVGQTSLR